MGRLFWQVHKAECERLAGLLHGRLASLGGGWMFVSFPARNGLVVEQKKQGWGEMRMYLERVCRLHGIDTATGAKNTLLLDALKAGNQCPAGV